MLGLALEGGGAKGAYQIGVWKFLKDKNIKINGVVGTSAGAINAAAIAMNDLEFAEDMWKELTIDKIVKGEVDRESFPNEFNSEIIDNLDDFYKKFIKNEKGLDIAPMLKMLKENIREDIIRKSKIDFGLVTYNLSLRQLEEIFLEDMEENSLYKYIMASSYLPLFKAVKLNKYYYLDGGFFNNLPINMLVKKGYKKIISVRLRPERYDYSVYRDVKIIDISPKESLGGTLEFDKSKISKNIELGYKDAERSLSNTFDSFIS